MQTIKYEEWLSLDWISHEDSKDGLHYFNIDMVGPHQMECVLETIPALGKDGPWLVGGTLRRLMAGEQLTTDYDIMFKDPQQFNDFCGQMRERGAETIEESDHQITFKHHGKEIQAIRAVFSSTLNQTLQGFDFTLCQFGYDGTNLVWGDTALEDVKAQRLVFTQTNDPISTLRRAFKYANQGFFFDHIQIAKLLKAVTQKPDDLVKAEDKWVGGGSENPFGGFFRTGRISARPSSYGV